MPSDITASPVNLPAQRRRSVPRAQVLKNAENATKGLKPVGRPLSYSPDLCERVIALGNKGKSWAAIARAFNISRNTLYEWEGQFPEFKDALARARAASQAWWEDDLQRSRKAKHYQAQSVKSFMGAQFEDYREQRSIDVTVSLEGIVSALQQREAPKVVEGQATLKDDAHTQAQDVVGPNGRIDKATD